jgi:hypothetical protein
MVAIFIQQEKAQLSFDKTRATMITKTRHGNRCLVCTNTSRKEKIMQVLCVDSNIMFMVEHRTGAGGPSLHLLVRTPKREPYQETSRFQQVWRADCFEEEPHEHIFHRDHENIHDLSDTATSAIEYYLQQCAGNLAAIMREAGYPELATYVSTRVTSEHIATLRQFMEDQLA